MRKRSYVWKISLPYLVILLIVLAGISIYLSNYFQNFIEDSWKRDLTDQATLYAQITSSLIELNHTNVELNTEISAAASQSKDRVTIILPNGQVIADNEADPTTMQNHSDRPEVITALKGQVGSDIRASNTLGTRFLYVAVPVRNEKEEIIAVSRVAVSLATLDESIAKIRRILIYSSLTAILVVFLISLYFTLREQNPLTQLTDTVETMTHGGPKNIKLSQRQDEIGTLASSFYDLADKMSMQIADLKNERMKLNAILSNMSDGALLVDAKSQVLLINPAARSLFNFHEDITPGNRSLVEVVRSFEIVNLWEKCQQSNDQQSITFETPADREYLQVIGTQLKPALPEYTLLLFQNLTTRHRLETVRQDFVSNVSHELRTPLASLKALTETLQDGALKDPPAAEHFLSQMNDEIDNLTQMVQELLELARMESGNEVLQKKMISPRDLLSKAVDRMSLQAQRAGITLESSCPDPIEEIFADPLRLQEVLVNLIHNAIKFTQPGGRIDVSAAQQADQVLFSVSDTGIGISPDDAGRIFERFYKSDRSRSSGGTGLGLSICRHLVESHGGKIWVESKLQKGSTFTFSIPCKKINKQSS